MPVIEQDVLAHGMANGVMFENVTMNHDALAAALRDQVRRISPQEVGAAFIASLSTRTLHWRSALGSYAFARHMPAHAYEPWSDGISGSCGICGTWPEPELLDLNRMSYFRLKWGGGPHDCTQRAWFNLSQFARHGSGSPTAEDWGLWEDILATIKSVPTGRPASELEKALGKVFKSNQDERRGLIEVLAIAGVLENPKYPGYFSHFIRNDYSNHAAVRTSDLEYPACRWKATGKVNEEAVKFWFG
jgi:hypothetical protein